MGETNKWEILKHVLSVQCRVKHRVFSRDIGST